MTATTDALKRLRSICATRNLLLEVTRAPSVTVSGQGWTFYGTATIGSAEKVFLRAHAAVLAKFPPLKATGGARA